MNAHDFSFTAIDGGPLPLAGFAGMALLLVNTASQCGYTPQYADLQALWQEYRSQGLVVLGVPANDFGAQEPGTEAEIRAFCTARYAVDFPLTAKVEVIGGGAHPLYRWLAQELGEDQAPKWNFHKYLLDGQGAIVGAWPSRVRPGAPEVRRAIAAALGN
ncbi:MAG: glutathione peroxidase [Alphaproteobacteria bacterium]|nr:glutathione peroxidase [Alphaproteobacteria bacterium]